MPLEENMTKEQENSKADLAGSRPSEPASPAATAKPAAGRKAVIGIVVGVVALTIVPIAYAARIASGDRVKN